MKEFKYVIKDAEGIHARPAGELVKAAKEFTCSITITKDGKSGDCKKIFGLMGLGVKQGNEVIFTFDGADEEAAYEAVSRFVQEKL
ncbi:MAG: HPr family phosphocarrier protein [Lachnospiraceae bacterium]|jgi:phosphocarrier protein|nr:HPr family phosphocarrier [Lachnospiraceae bacterium 10-1]MCX4350239.1 HPr family phosphocarrier protein [Lachnospiraceae bacterium]